MKIGTYIIDGDEYDWYCEDGSYYEVNINTFDKKPLTKAFIAQTVGNPWDESCIKNTKIIKDDKVEIVKFIPIYDWIFVQLYGEGKTEEEALKNVNSLYEEMVSYNDKIEDNIDRNLRNQMKRVHRFGIFPKDRLISTIDKDNDYYEDMEIIYFEDGEKDFRELAVDEGVPDDGRADEPVTGYIDGEKIVFTRNGFIQGEREKYISTINKYEEQIKNHYNLDKYDLYYSTKCYYDYLRDEFGNYKEEIVDSDFDYYIPISKR